MGNLIYFSKKKLMRNFTLFLCVLVAAIANGQESSYCDEKTGKGCDVDETVIEVDEGELLERDMMPCGGGGGLPPTDGKGRKLCLPPTNWMEEQCEEDEHMEECETRKGSNGELDNDSLEALIDFMGESGAQE